MSASKVVRTVLCAALRHHLALRSSSMHHLPTINIDRLPGNILRMI